MCTIWYVSSAGESPRDRLLSAVVEHLAECGAGDRSLRAIAEAVGTSHRMLLYHFGSREGLLAEVVAGVEAGQRASLARLAEVSDGDAHTVVRRFWATVRDGAHRYGPLFFELSAQAMQGRSYAAPLARVLVDPWIEPLAAVFARAGVDAAEARVRARLGLGVARGLLHDALVTGDWAGADAALESFADLALPPPDGPGAGSTGAGTTRTREAHP